MLAGLALTLVVVVGYLYSLFCLPVGHGENQYQNKWMYLQNATPNEIGDALAGVAGSLAFVWLVVTVVLQATELREQRKEFRKMADAQAKQVELLNIQGDIFRDEQRYRDEQRTWQFIEELFGEVDAKIHRFMQLNDWIMYTVSVGAEGQSSANRLGVFTPPQSGEIVRNFKSRFSKAQEVRATISQPGFEVVKKANGVDVVGEILELIEYVLTLRGQLNQAQLRRLAYMRLDDFREYLNFLLGSDFWTGVGLENAVEPLPRKMSD